MDNVFIFHHLGLGDHILCNAIVRTYCEQYKKVFLFVKPENHKNVAYMYRDLTNLKLIVMADPEIKQFISINPNNNYKIIGITKPFFDKYNAGDYGSFDRGFYAVAGVPFEDRCGKFYFQRDLEKEKDAYYNVFGLKDGEEYAVIHDDPPRGRVFKEKYIPQGIKLIHPIEFKEVGIFDFIYTLENAKEVHVMNSSFSCLIDTMLLQTKALFLHEYARINMGNHEFMLKWNFLKD